MFKLEPNKSPFLPKNARNRAAGAEYRGKRSIP
jgi:hypothetical protein